MYSTCLFCNHALGTNERIERLPVGHRIAFDPGKGRLWVVCASCGRWNLTPLEARWEAVEECERTFRGARLRASSKNISLAHLKENFELIRIGEPLRPEFAAWRYGSRFIRRWRESWFVPTPGVAGAATGLAAGIAVGVGASFVASPVTGVVVAAIAGVPVGITSWFRHLKLRGERRLTWVSSEAGIPEAITGGDAFRTTIHHPTESASWSISVLSMDARRRDYEGAIARRILGSLMMHVNWRGATRSVTDLALQLVERAPEGDDPVGSVAMHMSVEGIGNSPLYYLPPPVQLALEMAVHENLERPAVEGHLAELRQAWREAEEIAAIADNLFLPPAIDEEIARMRKRSAG